MPWKIMLMFSMNTIRFTNNTVLAKLDGSKSIF